MEAGSALATVLTTISPVAHGRDLHLLTWRFRCTVSQVMTASSSVDGIYRVGGKVKMKMSMKCSAEVL